MKHLRIVLTLLMTILIATMAVATFVEQRHGASYAATQVYHTSWFFALWALMALGGMAAIWRMRLWRRLGVMLLHAALLLILAGAAASWLTSSEGTLHLRKNQPADCYTIKDSQLSAPLPFLQMTLQGFSVVCYPGTEAPQDFQSRVTYITADRQHHEAAISMNHILEVEGYRFYQTSFDPDRQGSVLTVNYDPWGTPISYGGYVLLALSMVWLLIDRRETFGRLLRSPLLRQGATLMLLIGCSMSVHARSVPTITAERANRLAEMPVVYNDRIAPLNTLARDFLLKLYGHTSYKGLTAEQVVYGWMQHPETWSDEPMLLVKDSKLRQQLGIDGKYARLADLFDNTGRYRLQQLIASSGETKAVRELDEKVGIILMLTEGELLRPASGVAIDQHRLVAEICYNRIPFVSLLFMTNLTLGILAFCLLLAPAFRFRHRLWQTVCLLGGLSWLVLVAGYALRWYISGRIPLGNGFETMLFLALALQTVGVMLHRRLSIIVPFALLLSGFTLLVAHLSEMNPQITSLMPVLQSPLLTIHVSLVMMAYALLAFTMMSGIVALIAHHRGHTAHEELLTVLSQLMLYPAVFLLAGGIFLGAVWANVSWGKYWSWDPKEVWALITLLVYAVPLHRTTFFAPHRPVAYHLYILIAFFSVLMTYFGVNYFLGGMHSYA